jgi:AraC-like DNA-binding protein
MSACSARRFPRHTHDEYGIGVVDSGGHGSWSGRGQVEAGPGTFISVNPGEVHDGRALGGRARAWRILYFEPRALRALMFDVNGLARDFEFTQPAFAAGSLRAAFERVFAQALAGADALACESAALELAAGLHGHSVAAAADRRDSAAPQVRRAADRMDSDPASPVTLAELAREASLSRYQLLRAFRRAFGLPPHAYLLQRRLSLARALLRAQGAPAEVAARAGFSDQSHLTRCFTRQFGISPGRYAARYR